MNTPALSICVPSNRNLELSKSSIENVHSLSKFSEVEVIVSDNSGDTSKFEKFSNLNSANFRYIKSPHSGPIENWRHALNGATGSFLSVLSDDDLLVPLPGFDPKKLEIDSNAIGFRPHMAMFSEQVGIYNHTNFDIQGNRAIDRVIKYFDVNGGANITLFSFFKRSLATNIFSDFHEFHPTKGGYTDWAIALGLLSSGQLPKYNKLLYIYNNSNWDTQENVNKNILKAFAQAGLPQETVHLLPIFNALDSFAAISRKNSPIAADEKMEAAYYALLMYFNGYAKSITGIITKNNPHDEKLKSMQNIISEVSTPLEVLAACLLIIDIWLPGYADRYQKYFNETLDGSILRTL